MIAVFMFFHVQEHEVDKMFPLRPGRLPANTVQNVVFITRPKLSLMELVAQNVLKSVLLPMHLLRSCFYWSHIMFQLLLLYEFFICKKWMNYG